MELNRKKTVLMAIAIPMSLAVNAQNTLSTDTLADQTLEEYVVVAQKPLVKMKTDKMTYNVKEDADSKTSTVLDMLRKVPMVTVDGQDNITVNGSSSFKVYVNGKPSLMFSSNPSQIFKSMPASAVKSIEVITNPGAKYDAEGTGGVLNIVMDGAQGNSNMSGMTGNVRITAGSKVLGGGAFISGQEGKLSYSANAIINQTRSKDTDIEFIREQYGEAGTSTMNYKQKSDTKMPFKMANITLGYEPDSMSNIGLTAGITDFTMKNSGDPYTTMGGGIYGKGFSYGEWMRMDNKKVSFNASMDYQRFLNKERSSSIAFTYLFSHNPTTNENWREYKEETFVGDIPTGMTMNDMHSKAKEKSTEHTGQIDFTTPIAQGHTLNAGAKFIARNNESQSDYFNVMDGENVINDALCMDYTQKNSILAGYAEYDGRWGKWGTKAGLRYEHTWQDVEFGKGKGENFKNDYGNLVPTANISLQLAPAMNIGLTYDMRIARPGISYLNPYVDRSSTTSISYGNPDLDVEKTHNIGMVYNFYSAKFMTSITLKHSICDNGIEQYSFYEDNLLNTTYGNIVKRRQTSLNVFANLMIAKDTKVFLNGGASYNDFRSTVLDTNNHGWQANMMIGLQHKLPWEINSGIYLISNSKTYTLQGWNSGFNMISANFSKSLLKDRLNIGISGMAGLAKDGELRFDAWSKGKDFQNRQRIHVPMSSVMLNVTYNFGNMKFKAKDKRNNIKHDVIEHKSMMENLNNMEMKQ